MNTNETVYSLRLMASTIEELEIDNIISCEVNGTVMSCHLHQLKLTNVEAVWKERHTISWPWKKTFTYNNIYFYALYSQEQYDKEQPA